MGPGGSAGAVEGPLPHLLHRAQLVQGQGEGVHRVVDERRGRVQVAVDVQVGLAAGLHHGVVHDAVQHVLHLGLVHVDQPEVRMIKYCFTNPLWRARSSLLGNLGNNQS